MPPASVSPLALQTDGFLSAPVRRWGSAALLAAAGAAMVAVAMRDVSAIRAVTWSVRPGRLLAASALEASLVVGSVALWGRALSRFADTGGVRVHVPLGALLRVWVRTTLAKYIPGSIWPLVTTATQASRLGVAPVALSAAFVLHGAFTVLGALAVAGLLGGWGPLAAAAAVAVGGLAHPAVLNRVLALGGGLARRDVPHWTGGWADGATLVALHAAVWAGYGLAFALFASALVPVGLADVPRLVGAHALSFVAGFAAVFAPGGVGVREAALVGLLVPVWPASVGLVVAAASRVWLMATEALVGVVALGAVGRLETRPSEARLPEASPASAPAPAAARGGPAATRGNVAEPLLDSANALGRIAEACRAARQSVRIAQLAFDVDCRSAARDDGTDERLVDALAGAAAAGADVRVVLNGSILMNTVPALRAHFAAAGAAVDVRGVSDFPNLLHAKLVLVDDAEAFLVGSPFVNGYWDDGAHRPLDPRRPEDDLAGRPIHDLSVRVTGPAVADLAAWFDAVWDAASDRGPARAAPRAPIETLPEHRGTGDTAVRVLRTRPPRLLGATDPGRTEILDAYVDAIRGARSLVYLENQYFSSRPVRAALVDALAANPELEVILVLNQNPDITAYRGWQNRRLAEAGLLGHPRVGVFSLWATARGLAPPHRPEVTQLFIHSKVAVIDDAWATVGTANLDGVSLDSYGDDFSLGLLRRLFRPVRNMDLNLAFLPGADGRSETAADLRKTLWARHLGVAPDGLGERPDGGWLPLWRARADAHARALAAGRVPDGHVLAFASSPRPRTQLAALGIDVDGLDLRFDPSWVEVLFSPGWLVKTIPEPVRTRFARRRPDA